jgi:hypothetical protein
MEQVMASRLRLVMVAVVALAGLVALLKVDSSDLNIMDHN